MLVILLAGSCADGETDRTHPVVVGEGAQLSTLAVSDGSDDLCELLPCDGPCSLACDHDALVEQYVPDGTCASFVCELTDGRTVVLDACNYADD